MASNSEEKLEFCYLVVSNDALTTAVISFSIEVDFSWNIDSIKVKIKKY